MSKPLRVLQICSKPPFPAKDGGALAMNVMTQSLCCSGVEVFILTAYSYKHPLGIFPQDIPYRAVFIDLKPKIRAAIANLFSAQSYIYQRFYSKNFEVQLIDLLKEQSFDIIQLESLFASPYINCIRKYSKAKIFLRTHNVEYAIWKGLAAQETFLKKIYFNLLSVRLKKEEKKALNAVDGVLSISKKDTEVFREMGVQTPIHYIPFGLLDMPDYKPTNTLNLFFLGAMDWLPNRKGLERFLQTVWTKVYALYPNLRFKIAGKNMSLFSMGAIYPNIEVIGEVEDAQEFMQTQGILIAPIFSGSGVKIKILEAMSLGKIVITTEIGYQGLEAKQGSEILIANTPDDFIDKIGIALKSLEASKEEGVLTLGEKAYRYVQTHHNGLKIAESVVALYKEACV